ncbi:MAG: hypothetical protein ACKOH8_07125, partial [Gemmatimonadota bacterium]
GRARDPGAPRPDGRRDIIGDHLTEINVTSAGMFKEMLEQTGVHLGATLLDLLEARARAR